MITKLTRTPCIYLVGFMGCGKTTIARMLADELGWNFCDLDDEIEAEQQVAIAKIFETRGEEEFRRIEHTALRKRVRAIQAGQPTVMALGGGTLARNENFELIEDNGVSIWLDCPLEVVRRRVEPETHRPLARDPDRFEELYHERKEAYAKADFRVEILSDDPNVATDQILALPLF